MSTPKKETKKNAETPKAETPKADGEAKSTCHTFASDKDGNFHEATKQEVANAKAALITTATKTDAGIKVFNIYDCHIKNCDNGNIVFTVRTSDAFNDEKVDNPKPQDIGGGERNDKITLVGRGNAVGAALALTLCCRAYCASFGQESSYSLVRMELDKDSKSWRGLFVPAMMVAIM